MANEEYHMGFTLPQGAVQPPPLPGARHPWPNTTQPTNQPPPIPNCPPGLEYLAYVDQLIIHQTTDTALQTAANFETENEYHIANKNEQKIYHAKEKSDACARNCCKTRRSFEMKIADNLGKEVIHMIRPFACPIVCLFCRPPSMEVFAPLEQPIGTIVQECGLFGPSFAIKNETGEIVLRIKGPCNWIPCCSGQDFDIVSIDGSNTQVGQIRKKPNEHLRGTSNKEDCFGLFFPANLDVRMKAVLIGACFLIDMMYFEESTKAYQDEMPNHLSPI